MRAGSNGVNVFLGLGTPWVVAAFYYLGRTDDVYFVSSDGLSYALILYLLVAAIALALMYAKRRRGGGELGGAGLQRYGFAAAMVGMWLSYVVLVALDSS